MAREQHESFPTEAIAKKLHEIKYLSSQKKVPRLTLRKEIVHLEDQLQSVMDSEKKEKDKESVTIAALKQQIAILKNKLKAVEDLELDKKVDHLSFLLAEHLARKEVAGEIAMSEAAGTEDSSAQEQDQAMADKAAMLHRRLNALKQELGLHRELQTKKPEEMREIEEKIRAFEDHLRQFYEEHPELGSWDGSTPEVKHKMLFPQEIVEEIKEAEQELPLPPPPKMGRKE